MQTVQTLFILNQKATCNQIGFLDFCKIALMKFSSIFQPQNRFGVTPKQYDTYSVADCRGLVKTLVCGVKTITWGIGSCKAGGTGRRLQ